MRPRPDSRTSFAAARAHGSLDRRRVPPAGRFRHPRLYLVGEAPGAEEADRGRPFVGPAGAALRAMLDEAGVEAAQVRIANAVPFRPLAAARRGAPRTRPPTAGEIARYGAAVLTDIRRSKPAVIVALGRTAARLFGESRPIREARRADLRYEGRPLRVTFHPAYVRRFGGPGGRLWTRAVADLRRAWVESG